MGRILAIDYGLKRTGLAVSDPLRIIAGALDTVATHTLMDYLKQYLSKNDVSTIVVGQPKQTNGEMSESWRAIEPFVNRLRKEFPQTEVVLYDERFTSVLAHRTMLESGIRRMARRDKALVDRISATIILQDYMQSLELRGM